MRSPVVLVVSLSLFFPGCAAKRHPPPPPPLVEATRVQEPSRHRRR